MKYLVVFLLPIFLFGSINVDSSKVSIYKNTYILDKNISINEVIESKEFSKVPNLYVFLNNKFKRNFWIKIPIENVTDKDLKKSLLFFWKNANINIYYHSPTMLKGPYHKKESDNESIIVDNFKLNKQAKLDIYIQVLNNTLLDDFRSLFIVNQAEVHKTISINQRFFSDGLFLGILIMILFSGLILYFSTWIKSYLYFLIFIVSIIFIFSNLRWVFFSYFVDETKYHFYIFMHSFIISLFLISLSLFTKEFFELKKEHSRINTLLNIYIISIILTFIFELTYSEDGIFPFYPVSFLPLFFILGIFMYKRHGMFAIFYALSIFIFTIPFFINNLIRVFNFEIDQVLSINAQVSSTVGSLILSLATLIKLRGVVKERRHFEQQAIIKSRFSAMGEMIGNIAHQWRQPLSHLSSIFINIEMSNQAGKLTPAFFHEKMEEANLQLNHMSNTIEDFRNFFSQSKKKEVFYLSKIVEESINLMHLSLDSNHIQIDTKIIHDKKVCIYANELRQVIISLITNAKDALKNSPQENRHLTLKIDGYTISVIDNAGGIDEENLTKIFEPYFTTKQSKNGTGLGLYMSKSIIENNIGGVLYAENTKKGAKFTIDLSNINKNHI